MTDVINSVIGNEVRMMMDNGRTNMLNDCTWLKLVDSILVMFQKTRAIQNSFKQHRSDYMAVIHVVIDK